MDRSFRKAVITAKLDPDTITPHVMRHTAITKLAQAGVDIPTIQRISGHKTVKTVMRYTHVHDEHVNNAIAAIGMGILELIENETPATVTPKLHVIAGKGQ
jgi:site-specific recombinase XerD